MADDRGPPPLDEFWATFERYTPMLLAIAAAWIGQLSPADEVDDLVAEFLVTRLRAVVARARHIEDRERADVFVRAAFRNFLRNALRSRRREEKALAALAEMRVDIGSAGEPDSPEGSEVRAALEAVGAVPRRAAGLYLGLHGPARSVRQVAEELDLSRYAARNAVADGILGAAIRLGEAAAIEASDVEAVRLVVVEGLSIEDAAASLGVPAARVRKALQAARDALAL